MKTAMPRRPSQHFLVALVLGCGAAPEAPADGAAEEVPQIQTPSVEGDAPQTVVVGPPPANPVAEPTAPPFAVDVPAVPAARAPCSAPSGVSASPRNVSALVELINSLPRPTSLPCLLETLQRPLEIYLTRSE